MQFENKLETPLMKKKWTNAKTMGIWIPDWTSIEMENIGSIVKWCLSDKVDKSSVIKFDWSSTDLETFRMDWKGHNSAVFLKASAKPYNVTLWHYDDSLVKSIIVSGHTKSCFSGLWVIHHWETV